MTTIVTETVTIRDHILRPADTSLIAVIVDSEGKALLFTNGTGNKATAARILQGIVEDLTAEVPQTIELKALPTGHDPTEPVARAS